MKPAFVLLSLLCAALVACGPVSTPDAKPTSRHSISYDRPDVGTTAAGVDRVSRDVRREADALRDQVGTLRHAAAEASRSAATAESELQRLIVQQGATEDELVNLGVLFKDAQQRNLFLEANLEELGRSHDSLKVTMEKQAETITQLRVAATRADEGKAEMKNTIDELTRENATLRSENERLSGEKNEAQVKGASAKAEGKGYGKVLLFIGLGVVVVVGVFVGVRALRGG